MMEYIFFLSVEEILIYVSRDEASKNERQASKKLQVNYEVWCKGVEVK